MVVVGACPPLLAIACALLLARVDDGACAPLFDVGTGALLLAMVDVGASDGRAVAIAIAAMCN
eukprot:15471143-Alexandrium_andersonii.AAC.1